MQGQARFFVGLYARIGRKDLQGQEAQTLFGKNKLSLERKSI